MQEFSASLVREKISISEVVGPEDAAAAGADVAVSLPIVLRSNRLALQFTDKGKTEVVVIRAQTMSMTLRIAAKVFFSYEKNGLFLGRAEPYAWQEMWDLLQTAYDIKHNPDVWAIVYINGRAVFSTVQSEYMDVIEKYALDAAGDYDTVMQFAEKQMQQDGRLIKIEHASKVAAVYSDDGKVLRCGVIQRADSKDTTFSFSATGGVLYSRVVQGFQIAAAFLEAIDIRHYMRLMQLRLNSGLTTKNAPEMVRYNACPQRLKDLRLALEAFEKHFDVRYRPEKPDVFVPPKEGG